MTAIAIDAAPPTYANKRAVAATVAGNAIEFYDFLSFGFFAVYISGAFFPGGDPTADLLKTLAVFWAGFLFRPLGGVLIGRYADRAGRRPAMLLTIALITFGTMGVAFTPGYATLGPLAPAILVFFRIVQGFALGGEVGPASVYLVEAAPPGRRSLYASWQIASQGIAGVAAGLVGVGLATVLTPQQLADWGWRVPFLLCLALIPVAFVLRGEMTETLTHAAPTRARPPVATQVRYIALGVMLIVGGTVSTYVSSSYMATYAIATLKLPARLGLSATLIGGLSTFVFALLGGWLGDHWGRKALVLAPRLALIVVIWPLFLWLSAAPSALTLWIATIAVSGLTALSAGVSLVILPELLPRETRAFGFAISYALGVTIFGGSTPLVVTKLIAVTGDPTSPAFYVILTSLVTIAALFALPETRGRDLD
jgi:MFS family permease